MKCYLHIGHPKTGTTSIQEFLLKNKDILENNNYSLLLPTINNNLKNIIYPEQIFVFAFWDTFDINNTTMTGYFNVIDEETFNLYKKFALTLLKDVFSTNKSNNIIISAEMLFILPRASKSIENMKRILESFGVNEFKVIYYIRNQVDLYGSLLNEFLKGTCMSIDEVYVDYMDFNFIISEYEKVFKKDNIDVRIFDRSEFKNSDIIEDFLESIDLDINIENCISVGNQNKSVSYTGMKLLSKINKSSLNINGKFFDNINAKLFTVKKEIVKNFTDGKYYLTEEKYIKIKNEYKDSNEIVRKEYFPNKEHLFNEKNIVFQENISSINETDIISITKSMVNIANIVPTVSYVDKINIMSNLLEFVNTLDKSLKYAIYGYGTVAKIIEKLFLSKYNLIFFDSNPLNDEINNLEEINNLSFDKIIISPIGRENDIIIKLVGQYNIEFEKIVIIDI